MAVQIDTRESYTGSEMPIYVRKSNTTSCDVGFLLVDRESILRITSALATNMTQHGSGYNTTHPPDILSFARVVIL